MCRLLAWTMLDRNGTCDTEKLDQLCEEWLDKRFNIKMDFEVEDGLAKLLELDLVSKNGELWAACDLVTALERLDTRWDNYFQFSSDGPSSGPSSIDAEPIVAEPIVAEPIDAEPIAAEPIVAEPIDAEPIVA